ncbi:MAG: ribosome maturation factor RimP [Candidatus Dormibacterales bacterium]
MPSWPLQAIRGLLEPSLRHLGFEIYGLQQAGGGGRTLRIALDRAGGVSLDDCARVSEMVGPLLDQAALIPGPYTLEVSSPGAERALRARPEYERFVGSRVNVRYRMDGSEAVVEGDLLAVDGAGIAVRLRTADVLHVSWEDILAARLAVSI